MVEQKGQLFLVNAVSTSSNESVPNERIGGFYLGEEAESVVKVM